MRVDLTLRGLSGWRRRAAAIGLGALAALALPPLHWLPVLLLAFPGLVWLLDGARTRKAAFGAGFWFGIGWFAVGLYWISHALLTDVAKFGWMIPFAVFGLSAVLAAFTGVATLAAWMARVGGAGRVLMLAAAWTGMEWVRAWAFTGFPWNPVGSVWDIATPMLQFGAVAGVFGLSLLTVLAASAAALLAEPGHRRIGLALVLVPLVGLYGFGAARLAGLPDPADPAAQQPGIRLRLVQAAISQQHKWREDLRAAHLQAQVALSREAGFDSVTHVVWPETAAPFFLDHNFIRRLEISDAVPPGGLVLTGAPRATPPGEQPFQIWNSLQAIDGQAEVVGTFDKVHLVPFGEYVPLRAILPIAKITHGGVDFSSGPGLRTLTLPGLPPFSPLICYEAIFPAEVVGRDQPRPDWLLAITNDGWFGLSAGPWQHLAAARMRAVEEGLPLVRAANTGVSAVMDGHGRMLAMLTLGQKGVVDSTLPRPLPPTLFSRLGNGVALGLALLCAMAGLLLRARGARRDTPW